ncbi:MAG: 2-oxo acid dehydrogenase subunit E2 [Novosphingobium sp.]|nr:2-oxo acid dehydrogenase subunit E2 [Novosphingobium sp.]
MSRFEFKLSDIGEGIAEAELVEWLAQVGDTVKEDQPLAAFMTDKATVELESPVSGKVVSRIGEIGDAVRVGATIMEIEVEGDVAEIEKKTDEPAPLPPPPAPPIAAKAPPPPPPPPSSKFLASPVVRRRAHDLGVDLTAVPHSGPRVLNADLDAYLVSSEEPAPARKASRLIDEDVPVVGMRRAIARKMEEAKRRIPHFTYVEEIDMTECERLRAALNEEPGARISILPILIAAVCRTLPDFPQLNAHYYDDTDVVRRFGAVHMGVATQTDAGLMVPVLRDADGKSLGELAQGIAALAQASRSGKILRDSLQGSTITISSLGKLGGIAATPILNAPEVCIIGPNKIEERPVVLDGTIAVRKMMNLSISCDHRVVDGHDAAAFVQALKRKLEIPALIFANG